MRTERVVRTRSDSVEQIEGLEEKVKKAVELLPAWFVARMMNDEWRFGLFLGGGFWVAIARIVDVKKDASGDIWIDALGLEEEEGLVIKESGGMPAVQVAKGRRMLSLNAKHVALAVELDKPAAQSAPRPRQERAP
jgi:hypothetical protein